MEKGTSLVLSALLLLSPLLLMVRGQDMLESVLSDEQEEPVKRSSSQGSVSSCPDGWHAYGGHCYMLPYNSGNWDFAQAYCNQADGYLVQIQTSGEQNFVFNLLQSAKYPSNIIQPNGVTGCQPDTRMAWMGATDRAREGQFVWVATTTALTYTNWGRGQPDNDYKGLEHCLEMSSNGKWNDFNCQCNSPFVCESEAWTAGNDYN